MRKDEVLTTATQQPQHHGSHSNATAAATQKPQQRHSNSHSNATATQQPQQMDIP